MATYKKRGHKPKNKVEKEVLTEENSTTAEVFNTLDETASKTEAFVAKNQKYIFIIIGVVAAAVLGWLGYQELVVKPKQEIAVNEMYQAQKYFDEALTNPVKKDSLFALAIKGGNGKFGFKDLADKFENTKTGNLANYYAGMAYLNLKDYKNAISYLDNYSNDDEIFAAMAKGGIGDAFMQLNNKEQALEYYEAAANIRTNEFTTPMFLYKAGTLALNLGKSNKALGYFQSIKDTYSKSNEAANIDVFIAKAKAML